MARLNVAGHLTPDKVFRRYRDCADGRVKSRWHALWLMVRPDGPVSAGQAAATVGLSDVWARKLVHRYNGRGPDSLADGRAGNRSKPKLDEARQAEPFEALKGEPPDGGLRAGPKVALYVSARWGLQAHPNTGRKWLRKLGFRLGVPRPKHPGPPPRKSSGGDKDGLNHRVDELRAAPPRWPVVPWA